MRVRSQRDAGLFFSIFGHFSGQHAFPLLRHSPMAACSFSPFSILEQASMESIAGVLDESVATVKNMAFKKRGLLSLTPDEIKAKIEVISKIVGVSSQGN